MIQADDALRHLPQEPKVEECEQKNITLVWKRGENFHRCGGKTVLFKTWLQSKEMQERRGLNIQPPYLWLF